MAEDDAPWSTLGFAEEAAVFKGLTRNARVLGEGRVAANAFCPGCGATPLTAFAADAPVADFHCGVCAGDDELKATRGRAGGRDPSPGGWRVFLLSSSSGKPRLRGADRGTQRRRSYAKAKRFSQRDA